MIAITIFRFWTTSRPRDADPVRKLGSTSGDIKELPEAAKKASCPFSSLKSHPSGICRGDSASRFPSLEETRAGETRGGARARRCRATLYLSHFPPPRPSPPFPASCRFSCPSSAAFRTLLYPIVLPVCRVRANIAFHIPSKEQKIVTVPFARALRGKYLTAAVVVPFPAHPASH